MVAIALKAKRLVFMSDVPGLLRDPKKPDSVISHLRTEEVGTLKKAGVIDKGMIPKVDSAVAAIQSGVEKVSFVDGRACRMPCAAGNLHGRRQRHGDCAVIFSLQGFYNLQKNILSFPSIVQF